MIDAARGMCFGLVSCAALAACLAAMPVRTYELYEPTVRHVTIYEGRLEAGQYPYNHMPSVEFFDGKFHAAWGGNPRTIQEGQPGQILLLSTSDDFQQWTHPAHFVGAGAGNPVDGPEVRQWQPNLLNYEGRELWCTWYSSTPEGDPERDGTYLSTLGTGPGAKWVNRRIFHRIPIDGKPFVCFPSGNPVLLKSGRVLAPATLYRREPGLKERIQWNVCLYTDDGGETWAYSNPIGQVDDYWAQWEPFFYEQADGTLRAFMRNHTRATPACTQWQLTCVGTGAKKGEPVVFDPDPEYSYIETANSRTQVFGARGGRYCMLHHDVWVDHRGYETRLNLGLFFSRTGADDYVAGPSFSRRNVISAYPQGIEHDGKIYVAYTTGPGSQARSIEGAIIDPSPVADQFYIWPREKDLLRMETRTDADGRKSVVRTNPDYRATRPAVVEEDGRDAILFERAGSAGVEIDPVDFAAGQSLTVSFEAKVRNVQERGNLILCSFGDRIPIRIGMPAHRVGTLYAYGAEEWKPVGPMEVGAWAKITLTFGQDTFSVRVGDGEAKTFRNPMAQTNPRLYLGDGYEVDYVRSNWESEFLIDLPSVNTQVQ
jgi:hypothetical protein